MRISWRPWATPATTLTLRHDMLCDSMDEGKGIASAEQIWARLRRGEHFSGTCRYRRRNGGAL